MDREDILLEQVPDGLPAWLAALWEGVDDIRLVDVEMRGEVHKRLLVTFVRKDAQGVEQFMPFLTVNGLALKAGITTGRVRQLLKAGRFPHAFKLKRQWLIPREDLAAYLAWPDRRRKPPGQLALPGIEAEVSQGVVLPLIVEDET